MSTITERIDVDVPVRTAYNQWTQFEQFPAFMEGVEQVRQIDDTTLEWKVEIAGAEREFVADITTQEPDQVVAWVSRDGEHHAGRVTFQPDGPDRTRVEVKMAYEPSEWTEKVADALKIIDLRVKGDLRRFKELIEDRGVESGAWRGRVQGGGRVDGGTASGSLT